MASIWSDGSVSYNNVVMSNKFEDLVFKWDFVSFSGEQQEKAEVRWRKMGPATNIATVGMKDWLRGGDEMYRLSPVFSISQLEDVTTWTLVGGQMTPPASGRLYSNITQVVFPVGALTPGAYVIQVRQWTAGATEWSGWTSHKIEVSDYDDRSFYVSSAPAQVKGPAFPAEGTYAYRVEVISAAGVSTMSSDQFFNVWQTDRYIHDTQRPSAVAESYFDGTKVVRFKR